MYFAFLSVSLSLAVDLGRQEMNKTALGGRSVSGKKGQKGRRSKA